MKLFILNFQVYHPNNKIYKEEFELHTSKIILRKFPNPKRLVRIYFIVQNRNFPKITTIIISLKKTIIIVYCVPSKKKVSL